MGVDGGRVDIVTWYMSLDYYPMFFIFWLQFPVYFE